MAFVVDNSVVMAWCFEDEANSHTEAALDLLLNSEAVVPAVWPLEVANTLMVGERRGRLTEAQTARFARLLRALPVIVDGEALTGALGLAVGPETSLSAYAAAYLEIAARRRLPLATPDKRLEAAAARLGIPLIS